MAPLMSPTMSSWNGSWKGWIAKAKRYKTNWVTNAIVVITTKRKWRQMEMERFKTWLKKGSKLSGGNTNVG